MRDQQWDDLARTTEDVSCPARPSAQEQGVVIHEGLYGLITPAPECLSDSGWVRRATRAETPSYQENRDPCV